MLTARTYTKVQRDSVELSEEAHIPPLASDTQSKGQRLPYFFGLSLLANIILALSCFLLLPAKPKHPDSTTVEQECRRLRSFEDIYDDASSAISCSTVRYDTGPAPNPPDFKTFWGRHWFEGSEDNINALWRQVSSIQLLSITAEEASRLPTRTARDADTPGQFAVTPQVFHDMHCLNYVRNSALGLPQMHNDEAFEERRVHTEHCLGLLRQSLLCEGNMQPIVYTTLDGEPQANPGATPRHCRNWGTLWEWARQRNITTGSVRVDT
ncbi:hypothetical protein B0T24DRAFT_643882 [Lasiosphaeria ovina]|uniref:Tat pathway signal sequence n=1 Tax=Lasiosphaeria ovina TaxID=92902 RepID=A0AAE0MYW2_9PEZI|nr:hypothetical protein B0T24DRAFT_643882 [Lasiosphaeria ovina]